MAFVFQAERQMITTKSTGVPQNVGPGSYMGHETYKAKLGNVPFDTQVTRLQAIQKDDIPGPGSYNINQEQENQKLILPNSQSEVKIVDKAHQQSVFASQSKRFSQQKALNVPGPGTYETEIIGTKPIQQQYTSQHYIETIMKLNKYQSIPSIPSNAQILGYNEKGAHDLELNKSPVPQFTGVNNDSVGPGQYQLKDAFEINKNKGTQWHKSKALRLAPTISKERELMVGPGAYDGDGAIVPLHKLNPSGNFISKSQRMFDSKSEKQKQFMKIFFEKQKDRGPDDDEYEFQDETTPGPGHYHCNLSANSSMSTNTQFTHTKVGKNCFGAKSRRFQEKKIQYGVGPGDYQLEQDIAKEGLSQKQPPFLSTNMRFEQKVQEKRPGPQQYNPKITLEDKLIKKLERAPVGKFGRNEIRFQEVISEVPGPGSYDYKKKDKNAVASVFKSKTNRGETNIQKKDNFPAPGAYQVKNFTIEQATKIENEEDPDLAINKPAFGSSLPRFQDRSKKGIEEQMEDDEEDVTLMHNSSSLFKKKSKVPPAFGIQENRFQYEKQPEYQPGPGEYFDQKQNKWNKTTFNILFQEV